MGTGSMVGADIWGQPSAGPVPPPPGCPARLMTTDMRCRTGSCSPSSATAKKVKTLRPSSSSRSGHHSRTASLPESELALSTMPSGAPSKVKSTSSESASSTATRTFRHWVRARSSTRLGWESKRGAPCSWPPSTVTAAVASATPPSPSSARIVSVCSPTWLGDGPHSKMAVVVAAIHFMPRSSGRFWLKGRVLVSSPGNRVSWNRNSRSSPSSSAAVTCICLRSPTAIRIGSSVVSTGSWLPVEPVQPVPATPAPRARAASAPGARIRLLVSAIRAGYPPRGGLSSPRRSMTVCTSSQQGRLSPAFRSRAAGW